MLLKDAERSRAPGKGWINARMVPLLSVKPVSSTELAPSALPPCHCSLGRLPREEAGIGLLETHRLGAPHVWSTAGWLCSFLVVAVTNYKSGDSSFHCGKKHVT